MHLLIMINMDTLKYKCYFVQKTKNNFIKNMLKLNLNIIAIFFIDD